ncbi:MAG: methionine ABC transporter permease [Peptococcaceae bacterium]|jgi:D-methionine transport system permease protein|nr:methionine ABC transporter permease [Peptococcaceae bacterium]MEE0207221.1 methionine ABC transporter permease [Peptococcaceae bacterium]
MLEPGMLSMLAEGTWQSIYMTVAITAISYLIGIPLGVFLVMSDKNGIHPMASLNWIVGGIVNILRSVPFLILMITIQPFTRMIVGTTIGTKAAIVALVVSAAPFVARMVEQSLLEIDHGVIEAAQSMGASNMQIVTKVLLPESLPSLLNGVLVSATTILGYSAMAGFIGGGGLGDIAIRYGYNRYDSGTMLITVVLLVIMVQIIQSVGSRIAKRSDKRIND